MERSTICFNEGRIKDCNCEEDDCITCDDRGFRVYRCASDELVEICGNGIDDILKMEGIVQKLSELTTETSTLEEALKNSLIGIEMQLYDVLAVISARQEKLFFNMYFDQLVKNSETLLPKLGRLPKTVFKTQPGCLSKQRMAGAITNNTNSVEVSE